MQRKKGGDFKGCLECDEAWESVTKRTCFRGNGLVSCSRMTGRMKLRRNLD
jgi:hypothetical protein